MHKFFVSKEFIEEKYIRIYGDDVNHISRVLRLRAGEQVNVSDGEGNEYICSIASIDKTCVTCDIINRYENVSEPPVKVDLYQGIPKSAKMDIIIQKCIEIGVNSIFPVNTERVIVRSDEEKGLSGKIVRWQRIAEEAAKQSGRGIIPKIGEPLSFSDALKRINGYDLSLIPYEGENHKGLKHILKGNNNIKRAAIFIGPEGGFSQNEINMAAENGTVPVTLGPRILRTETAGFVCLSFILYELGDMGGKTWER